MRISRTALPAALAAVTAPLMVATAAHSAPLPPPALTLTEARCWSATNGVLANLSTATTAPLTFTVKTGSSYLLPVKHVAIGAPAPDGKRQLTITTDVAKSGVSSLVITATDSLGRASSLGVTVRLGTSGDDTITGTDGRDWILTRAGKNTVNAGGGDDVVCGGSGSAGIGNTANGGAGNDWVQGSGGNDTLNGGPGNDAVLDEYGDDTHTGGPGADRFSGGHGQDKITDFNPAEGDTKDWTSE